MILLFSILDTRVINHIYGIEIAAIWKTTLPGIFKTNNFSIKITVRKVNKVLYRDQECYSFIECGQTINYWDMRLFTMQVLLPSIYKFYTNLNEKTVISP